MLCVVLPGKAQPPLVIGNDFRNERAANNISYYIDSSNKLTYKEVLARTHLFRENHNHSMSYGYNDKVHWIRLEIENRSDIERFVFEMENSHLDVVELHQLKGDSLISIKNRQQLYYHHIDGNLSATLAQGFELHKGEKTVFLLKIKAITSLMALVTVYSEQDFKDAAKLKLFKYSVFTGILAFVFIFTVFLFFVLKDWVYFFYAGYVFAFWCSVINICGYFFALLPFGMADLRQIITFGIVYFSLKFTGLFLSVKKFSPRLTKAINYLQTYIFFCFGLFIFHCVKLINIYESNWMLYVAAGLFNLMLVLAVVVIMSCIITATIKGYKAGWFALISILPVLTLTLLILLSNYSILSYYALLGSYFVYAITFEFIVLFLGLAYRFKMYKDEQARLLVENANQQRELVNTLVTGQEIERKRIAEELHDSLGQWLSVTKLQLEAIIKGNITAEGVQKAGEYLDRSIHELRHISHDMMPTALIRGGVGLAVEELVKALNQTGKIKVFFYHDPQLNSLTDKQKEIAFYRIIQESLTNIVKHAAATEASIQLTLNDKTIQLMIEDNGKGFDTAVTGNGNGVKNIMSRVQLLAGQLEINSSPGQGTLIHVSVPV